MKRSVQTHVFESSPNHSCLNQAYRSADDCLFAVGRGEAGWVHEVEGEYKDCLGGDVSLTVFLQELDTLYNSSGTARSLDDLLRSSAEKLIVETPGSSVVVVGVLFGPDLSSVQLAHAGDCRAYLLRGKRLNQLTQDHTIVEELVRADKMSRAQVRESPFRSFLTRVAGPQMDRVDVTVEPHDRLFLCTAGLWHIIEDEELNDALRDQSNPLEFIENLCVRRDSKRGWAATIIDLFED